MEVYERPNTPNYIPFFPSPRRKRKKWRFVIIPARVKEDLRLLPLVLRRPPGGGDSGVLGWEGGHGGGEGGQGVGGRMIRGGGGRRGGWAGAMRRAKEIAL